MTRIATRAVGNLSILTTDIERLPGRARHQHRGLAIEGDFWDLSGWKSTIGYRLPVESVVEWPRTICAAGRWYGKKRVDFVAEWNGGHEAMLRTVWEWLDRADVVVGHNVAGFDVKRLNGEFALLGLEPPSPFKTVDTLKVARAAFGLESNTLDSLCQRFGIVAKSGKYSIATARAAVGGDRAAQRELAAYNRGDILASEALYDALRPWVKNHPHVGSMPTEPNTGAPLPHCPNCGSDALYKNGLSAKQVLVYQRYRCRECGANVESRKHAVGSGRLGITKTAA